MTDVLLKFIEIESLFVLECFNLGIGVPILKCGVYSYQNTMKCSSIKKKLISITNDRQNESRKETQLQNKKTEGKCMGNSGEMWK